MEPKDENKNEAVNLDCVKKSFKHSTLANMKSFDASHESNKRSGKTKLFQVI